MNNSENSGLTPEDLEMLRKIQEEETKLYGGPQPELELALEEEFDADAETLLDNSENPALNKKLFYGLQSIINKNIRKGKLRDFVNNEKRLYLKSISEAGDTRFSFKSSFDDLFKIADNWQRGDKNGFELGMAYYELNEKMNFHNGKNIVKANKKK